MIGPVILLACASVAAAWPTGTWWTRQDHERPAALLALEEARRSIRTAEIEWSRVSERGFARGREFFFSSRVANKHHMLESRGDADGVVAYTRSGQPGSTGPERHLVLENESWLYVAGDPATMMWQGDIGVNAVDIRCAGLLPTYSPSERLDDALWSVPMKDTARDYRVSVEGGIHVVTAICDGDPEQTITWRINENKGWNAERVTARYKGEILAESISTLKQYGDAWFPEAVAYYGADRLLLAVNIDKAAFNRPDHAQSLSPGDIGVECGLPVSVQGGPKMGRSWIWDGKECLSTAEFSRRLKEGEVQPTPTVLRILKEHRLQRGTPAAHGPRPTGDVRPVRRRPVTSTKRQPVSSTAAGAVRASIRSEWERYTQEFIRKYQLRDDQSQKAHTILRACQDRAIAYLAKRAQAFAQLDKDRVQTKRGSPEVRKRRLSAFGDRRAELTKPIQDIFENQLKPQLEKLPTAAQCQRAGRMGQ